MPAPLPANPAQVYEHYFVPAMFQPWADILVTHAGPQQGESVLDVACGTGIVARTAAVAVGKEGRVVGVDISPAMLEVARSQTRDANLPVEWFVGSAVQLPCADAAFDLVLCQHGLQFFPDRTRAASEMHRVLRRGGRAAVLVLQDLSLHPVFEAVMASLAHRLQRPLSEFAVPFSIPGAQELQQPFAAAGFRTLNVTPATIQARFAEPHRFVHLAVASSAAAVPAFAGLEAADRASLLESVRSDTASVLSRFTNAGEVGFPMWGNVLVARD